MSSSRHDLLEIGTAIVLWLGLMGEAMAADPGMPDLSGLGPYAQLFGGIAFAVIGGLTWLRAERERIRSGSPSSSVEVYADGVVAAGIKSLARIADTFERHTESQESMRELREAFGQQLSECKRGIYARIDGDISTRLAAIERDLAVLKDRDQRTRR